MVKKPLAFNPLMIYYIKNIIYALSRTKGVGFWNISQKMLREI